MAEERRQRNDSLDALKLLACFLIVLLHCGLPGRFGELILALSRVAVPFFFLLSGYFCYADDPAVSMRRIRKGTLHLLKLTLFAFALYWLYFLSLYSFDWQAMLGGLSLTGKSWLFFFALNDTSVFFLILEPMWFLPALLYDYGIFLLVKKFRAERIAYACIPVLLAALFVLNELLLYLGIPIESRYYRNFLLTGLPFFLLGNWMHAKQDRLFGISDLLLCFGILSGAVYSCIALRKFVPEFHSCELSLGTQFTVFCAALLAIKHPGFSLRPLSFLGWHCSLTVYLVHMLVYSVFRRLFGTKPWFTSQGFVWILPVLVFSISIAIALAAYGIGRLVSRLHSGRERRI